jgi:ABC-type sugar transport system ATPase subunit
MTIYLKPATEFVATFVGSPPMNMVSLTKTAMPKWKEDLRTSVALFRKLDTNSERICKVGFRSETVTLHAMDDETEVKQNQTCIKGVVKAVLPTGAEQVVSVMVDEEQFYVVTQPTLAFENGQMIRMHINLDTVHIFDQKGLRV